MRLANGLGSVFYVKGRRNPWRAVSASPERKHIGYFATKGEATKALTNYAPSSIETFEEVYTTWSTEHYPKIENSRIYKSAYNRCQKLYNKKFSEIKLFDLEEVLKQDMAVNARRGIRLLFSALYKYAIKHDIAEKDYSLYIENQKAEPKKEKIPFSKQEIEILKRDDSEMSRMVLTHIYSGWRPSEMLSYNIEGDCMRGGSKTEAGRNRLVPIHPEIQAFIKEYRISYVVYRKRFYELMERLGMNHTPHECRHTFATMAADAECNEAIIKMILGHASKDVTEKVYTHRTLESLKQEIKKVNYR